jgi:hypothetical protein
MTDITEIKIKWEDTFHFYLVGGLPEAMRERGEGKKKPEPFQTAENHDTHANSMTRRHSSELLTQQSVFLFTEE